MDSKGVSHPVHSTLLRLKIPLFRYMDMGSSSTIVMDCASPDVVDLICQLVYNMDTLLLDVNGSRILKFFKIIVYKLFHIEKCYHPRY